MENSKLLILNGIETNLLQVLNSKYNLIEQNFEDEFDFKSIKFDLIILNLRSNEDLKIIKFFRNNPAFDYIPIVCIYGQTSKCANLELLQNGCDSCFITPINFEEFDIKISAILKRYKEICTSSISVILPHLTGKTPDLKLTCREMDLLNQIAKGLTNIEIAEILFLSEMTVKTHLKNIYKKLNVSNRTEAIIVAMKNNLLET